MDELQVDPRTGTGSDGRQYRQTEAGVWRACASGEEMFRGAAVAGIGVMVAASVIWLALWMMLG